MSRSTGQRSTLSAGHSCIFPLAPYAQTAHSSLARRAAEVLANYENRFSGLRRDMAVLKWMVGTLYPLVLAILVKLFVQ